METGPAEKAQHIIRAIMNTTAPQEFNYSFPRVEDVLDEDLIKNFKEQKCDDLDDVDVEYVDQSGDGDYGHHGRIAYRLHENTFLVMDFYE